MAKKPKETTNAAPQQAKQPVPKVSIPSRTGNMTKALAKENGLDPSIYGDIPAKAAAKKET